MFTYIYPQLPKMLRADFSPRNRIIFNHYFLQDKVSYHLCPKITNSHCLDWLSLIFINRNIWQALGLLVICRFHGLWFIARVYIFIFHCTSFFLYIHNIFYNVNYIYSVSFKYYLRETRTSYLHGTSIYDPMLLRWHPYSHVQPNIPINIVKGFWIFNLLKLLIFYLCSWHKPPNVLFLPGSLSYHNKIPIAVLFSY